MTHGSWVNLSDQLHTLGQILKDAIIAPDPIQLASRVESDRIGSGAVITLTTQLDSTGKLKNVQYCSRQSG